MAEQGPGAVSRPRELTPLHRPVSVLHVAHQLCWYLKLIALLVSNISPEVCLHFFFNASPCSSCSLICGQELGWSLFGSPPCLSPCGSAVLSRGPWRGADTHTHPHPHPDPVSFPRADGALEFRQTQWSPRRDTLL